MTLQGIIDGEIHGTVVQNPYRYGYESVRVLAGLARGDDSVLPRGGFQDIPARQIRRDNAGQFRDELRELMAPLPRSTDGGCRRPSVVSLCNQRHRLVLGRGREGVQR